MLGSETLETTYFWPANSLSHTAWPSPTQILHSCFTFSNPLQNQILHSFDQVPDYAVSCGYGVSHALSRLSAPNTVFSTVQFSSKTKFTHRNKALPGMTAFMSSVLSDLWYARFIHCVSVFNFDFMLYFCVLPLELCKIFSSFLIFFFSHGYFMHLLCKETNLLGDKQW